MALTARVDLRTSPLTVDKVRIFAADSDRSFNYMLNYLIDMGIRMYERKLEREHAEPLGVAGLTRQQERDLEHALGWPVRHVE